MNATDIRVESAGSQDIKERALDMLAESKEQLKKGTDTVRNYTTKEPVRALALALGMGVLLGWFIKRR